MGFKYFRFLVKREISELYISTVILNFAASTVMIFENLYLYSLGFSIKTIALIAIFQYVLFLFLLPLGGKAAVKWGFEHSIFYSIPFLALYYIFLYFTKDYVWMVFIWVFILVIFKILYWVSYHANFAHYGTHKEFGKQIGFLYAIVSIVMLLGPLLGGFILDSFGFFTLFFLQIVFLFMSAIPLFSTREKFKPGEFGYLAAWKRLFEKKRFKETLGFLGFGEEMIYLLFWPIFVFLVVGSYTLTGLITSLSTLVMIAFSLWWAKKIDGSGKINKKYYFGSVVFYALTYFIRVFIKTPLQVLGIGALDKVGRSSVDIPIYSMIYRGGREVGNVNQVVKFEMALSMGKILILIFGLSVSFIFPQLNFLKILFVLAGGFTLLYLLYYKK